MLTIRYVTAGWLTSGAVWTAQKPSKEVCTPELRHLALLMDILHLWQGPGLTPPRVLAVHLLQPHPGVQRQDPLLKLKLSASGSWLLLSTSLWYTQQLSCKSQPREGFHSQLIPPKNLAIRSSPSNTLTERRGSRIGRKPQACPK